MDDSPEPEALPPNLKLLRVLVTVLMVTMIAGFLVIVALFVIRMPGGGDALPLPGALVLPEGVQATAFTRGRDWVAVVTEDDRILIYDAGTGALRQTVRIER
ncbi:MAG: DUF6476 family protein [Rhodovulum sp.]